MLRSPWRAAITLFEALVLFAAPTQSQSCAPYNSSYTAGSPEDVWFSLPYYFGCPDGGFLVMVEGTYPNQTVEWLQWTCGIEDGSSLISTDSSSTEAALSFTVGITEVSTRVEDAQYPQLSSMYFGGYDVDSTGSDILFSWKGPFGYIEDDSAFLPGASFSSCSNGSFATGMTVWHSATYVYGVILECAYVSTTCAPLNYPASLLEDTSDSATDTPSSSGGTYPTVPLDTPSPTVGIVAATGPPASSSGDTVFATDPPSSSGDREPSVTTTPSPSETTSSGSDDASDASAKRASTSESSSSSVSSVIIVGASVAGGLLFLGACIGVACCLYRREGRKARHPDKPRDTFGTAAAVGTKGSGGGDGFAPKGGTVPQAVYASEVGHAPPAREPPPPYSDVALYRPPPPPYLEQ